MSRSALVAIAAAAILVLAFLARSSIGPLELIFLAAILSPLAFAFLPRGEILRFETSALPQEVINSAISLVGTHRRWATVSQTENSVTFHYHRPPSKLIAFILLLLFIVPGIVYLVLAGKKESLSISAARANQITVVQATSNGWRGRSAGRALRRQLDETLDLAAAAADA